MADGLEVGCLELSVHVGDFADGEKGCHLVSDGIAVGELKLNVDV